MRRQLNTKFNPSV